MRRGCVARSSSCRLEQIEDVRLAVADHHDLRRSRLRCRIRCGTRASLHAVRPAVDPPGCCPRATPTGRPLWNSFARGRPSLRAASTPARETRDARENQQAVEGSNEVPADLSAREDCGVNVDVRLTGHQSREQARRGRPSWCLRRRWRGSSRCRSRDRVARSCGGTSRSSSQGSREADRHADVGAGAMQQWMCAATGLPVSPVHVTSALRTSPNTVTDANPVAVEALLGTPARRSWGREAERGRPVRDKERNPDDAREQRRCKPTPNP